MIHAAHAQMPFYQIYVVRTITPIGEFNQSYRFPTTSAYQAFFIGQYATPSAKVIWKARTPKQIQILQNKMHVWSTCFDVHLLVEPVIVGLRTLKMYFQILKLVRGYHMGPRTLKTHFWVLELVLKYHPSP